MSRRDDRELIRVARELEPAGLVVGTLGNASVRPTDDTLRITPTRTPYAGLRRRDLVTVGLDGEVLSGRRAPSRELPLHLAVYCARPDARAIVHTHSPHATAWSFRGEPLEPALEETEYYALGPIRTSVPQPAGSEELASSVVTALGSSLAVLLGRHGVLTVGPTPRDALLVARVVEHHARIAWLLAGTPALASSLRAGLPVAAWN